MPRTSLALSAYLLTSAVTSAQPPPAGPPAVTPAAPGAGAKWTEVAARPGRLLRLTADAPGLRWFTCDPDGCDLQPDPDGKGASFVAPRAGRFKVFAVGSAGPAAHLLIVVGDAPPVPPTPPAPPAPIDPLAAKLRSLYDADPLQLDKRRAVAADLAALYTQAAALAADPKLTTAGQLAARVRAAGQALASDSLVSLRQAVAAELAAAIGTADVPLTDGLREKAAAVYARAAAALKGLAE